MLLPAPMLNWKDGLPFSDRFGDVYFSADSGLEETRHVFLQGNDLPTRFAALRAGESLCIGETGFGTGLNFLCAWQLFEQAAPAGASLDFFSTEKFPLDDVELRAALALWPQLASPAQALLDKWRRRVPGWNRWHFAGGRVRLTLALEDVAQALPQLPPGSVDAWFLDGFAPARNPEMWSEAVLAAIARASHAGTTLATYTSAGWVRRGLQAVGFEVRRVPGYGRKREMVRGSYALSSTRATLNKCLRGRIAALRGVGSCITRFAHEPPPQLRCQNLAYPHDMSPFLRSVRLALHPARRLIQRCPSERGERPRRAIIIGGGLAGCAVAHALAQRGVEVILLERAARLASAASGNPRGILHARFGAGMNALHRLVLAAYGHALGVLDEVLPVDGVGRAECGLLQLAATEAETKRIARLAALDWPPHLLQAVDAAQASALAGLPVNHGGLWFPAGGWVSPRELCARWVQHPAITVRVGCEATALEPMPGGWRVSGHDFELHAGHVVVCCAHHAKKLQPFAGWPLQPVRGQISEIPATPASGALKTVLCAEGYCAPALNGMHVAGATSSFDDDATDVRAADHAENLGKIATQMPALYQALGAAEPVAGRAAVRCSVPGATPLAGEVAPGLYCSLAHGTRGLLTAGLAAEVIAAAMCGQLPPLPQDLLHALAPLPRMRRQG